MAKEFPPMQTKTKQYTKSYSKNIQKYYSKNVNCFWRNICQNTADKQGMSKRGKGVNNLKIFQIMNNKTIIIIEWGSVK